MAVDLELERMISLKDRLLGGMVGGSRMLVTHSELGDDEEINFSDGYITKSLVNGILALSSLERVNQLLMATTVVLKLLGRSIRYNVLHVEKCAYIVVNIVLVDIPTDLIIMESVPNQDNTSEFGDIVADIHQKLESDLSELRVTEIDDMLLKVRDTEFTSLELSWRKENLTNSHEKILEHETKIKVLEETIRQANLELNDFLNTVADIHQKLESDLSELGVTETDDTLLKVRDAEFTGLKLSWMKEKFTNCHEKILEYETKIKMLEETIRQANLELARILVGIPIDLIIMQSLSNQDNASIRVDFEDFEAWSSWLNSPTVTHGHEYQVHPQNFEALNNIFLNHPQFTENFQLKHLEFQNNFLNAVADIQQKLESDISELGVTEIDDMLLKFAENFQLKYQEFQNNFLNAVADIHQKLESDLSELGVTEIDDMLLKNNWLNSPTITHGHKVYPQNFEALNNISQNHSQFDENFQLKHPEFQNNFLNAVAGIHQKLESNLYKLGVTEIDDMLLKVKDAEFTSLELSWMKKKLTNSRKKILKHETKFKMLEETIRQANLKLERLKKRPRLA
ncbi:hypothetical protein Goshw_025053 [Gossypium schwendimanii]|uniref:Uncharacterized protein n=1 Tax=Gossypium schwendimanii TaxID=34291 RepID=A0A7J9MQJ1_GOSSC|nr:hypothetical protein [Gossypium schwendimanii]